MSETKKTEKIYEQAKDKNVAAVKVYRVEDETSSDVFYACADAEGVRKLTKDELHDAFLKRCVVVFEDGSEYAPLRYVEDANADETVYGILVCGEPNEITITAATAEGTEETAYVILPLELASAEFVVAED